MAVGGETRHQTVVRDTGPPERLARCDRVDDVIVSVTPGSGLSGEEVADLAAASLIRRPPSVPDPIASDRGPLQAARHVLTPFWPAKVARSGHFS